MQYNDVLMDSITVVDDARRRKGDTVLARWGEETKKVPDVPKCAGVSRAPRQWSMPLQHRGIETMTLPTGWIPSPHNNHDVWRLDGAGNSVCLIETKSVPDGWKPWPHWEEKDTLSSWNLQSYLTAVNYLCWLIKFCTFRGTFHTFNNALFCQLLLDRDWDI